MKLQTPLLEGYTSTPLFVYDGGCPFCRHFAELSELRSGIKGLRIYDGRADKALRDDLSSRGLFFSDGAILIVDDQAFHGAEAIQWLCNQMNPSAQLLYILKQVMSSPYRSKLIYPLLRFARLIALTGRKLPLEPE